MNMWNAILKEKNETSTCKSKWYLPSLFIPAFTHLFSRHALHWFLCVLSTGHLSWFLDLHTYCRFLLMDLLKHKIKFKKKTFLNIDCLSLKCFTNITKDKTMTFKKPAFLLNLLHDFYIIFLRYKKQITLKRILFLF